MKAGWGTLYPLILAVLLIIFPYFISSSIKNKRTCVKKGEGNHLNWYIKDDFFDNSYPILDRLIILLYYISMTYAFATLNNKNIAYIFVILYNISFLITRLIYRETWASVWCHSVNAAAVFALFL